MVCPMFHLTRRIRAQLTSPKVLELVDGCMQTILFYENRPIHVNPTQADILERLRDVQTIRICHSVLTKQQWEAFKPEEHMTYFIDQYKVHIEVQKKASHFTLY